MDYDGPKARLFAAQDRDTPAKQLGRLARSDAIFVREAVATNSRTPAPVLASMVPAKLISEDDFRIALSLLRNPKLAAELAEAIAELVVQAVDTINPRDSYPCRLVDAVVRCTTVPAEAIAPLANPSLSPNHIRGRIAAPGARPELLAKLAEDPSEKIRSRARRAMPMN